VRCDKAPNQSPAASDSPWLAAISIHNSALAAGKFGGELDGYLDRPSDRANVKKSADDRQGICLVHQANSAHYYTSFTFVHLKRRSKPHILHSAMRRYALSFVPLHEELRLQEWTSSLSIHTDNMHAY
jgi:hypothetical protein